MLKVSRVHLPSEIPIVGCEILPYVILDFPNNQLNGNINNNNLDVPESNPLDGCFLKYKCNQTIDGCATFFRRDRFSHVKKYEVEFNKAAQSLTDALVPNAQKKTALNRLVKAVEMGKQLARRHFIHHVFRENEFEDGNHFYRFLEHEPFIPRCYNFRGSTNDLEPKAAKTVSLRLAKIMSAILESYAFEDGCHLDYLGINKSEEFRRYVNLMQELQRVDISTLSDSERLAFFLNLHNAMVIHAIISIGHPGDEVIDRRSFNSDFLYVIGGFPYSLATIINGVLRNNRRAPYSFKKPFGSGDKRLELAFPKVNPLIHFGICNGSKSSPPVRFFTPNGVESELRFAAREFLQRDGIQVDLAKRTVRLTRIFKWFSVDFGQEKEILKWIIGYLDATQAGLLSHLSSDRGAVHIVYQDYDWSINC